MGLSTSLNLAWFLTSPPASTSSAPASYQDPAGNNIQIRVFPEWYVGVFLTWSIPAQWGNCQFNVYFTSSGHTDFVKLNDRLLTEAQFSDMSSQDYSKYRHGFYIVEAYIVSQNRWIKSLPATWSQKRRGKIEKIATEIQRREYLLLSKFAGIKSYVFRRRPFGERCPRCWNATLEKVMDDHCPVCYGTSFEGGYFTPIPSFIQFEPTPNSTINSYYGVLEPNQIGAWTISMPEIVPGDVVIRTGDWNVYYVARAATTELQTNTVRQLLTLTQYSRQDVENRLAYLISGENPAAYLGTFLTLFAGNGAQTGRFPQNLLDERPENDYPWAKEMDLEFLPKPEIPVGAGQVGQTGTGSNADETTVNLKYKI